MNNNFDIFISYRRKGGFEVAKHIKDLLERDGYSVSFDIDNLRNGDFDSQLMERISNCKDFILILDAHVFDRETDGTGKNVDEGKEDWLVKEIAKALEAKKNIIPIMLDGFDNFPEKLPDAIKDVRYKNGPKYDREYVDAFYEKLKNFFNNSPRGYEDVGVRNLPVNLVCSVLLERGWLKYNSGKYDEAMEYFLEAAMKGSANAFNAVAIYYKEGHGYEKNPQKAVQWFRYAAEMGYASAQRNLGDCYMKGYGVQENAEEALRWYLRACEEENAKAQYAVGKCYTEKYDKLNISKKEAQEKAFEYYEKAADQGLDIAQVALAECYTNGIGCKKDTDKAVELYKKAAAQGNKDAQTIINVMTNPKIQEVEKQEKTRNNKQKKS